MLFSILFIIYFLVSITFAVTVVFLERRNVGATWAWLMVLFFLPGLGFVIYLLLGQNLSRRKIYKIQEDRIKFVQSFIYDQLEELPHTKFNDPEAHRYMDMIYMNMKTAYSVYTQNNEVEIFTDGQAKFNSLFKSIEEAKDHIHLMYYIVHDGLLGRSLINVLSQKAAAGVQVRFLYDDVGSSDLPKHFFDKLIQAGGEVAAFFPSKIPYFNLRVNYRNHRKLAIIDGSHGYIGGFNIGDEYLGLDAFFGYWRDTHLKITGTGVLQMQAQFGLDWNLSSTKQIVTDLRYFPSLEPIGKVGLQIVSSGPNQSEEQIENAYVKMIHTAKDRVFLQSPYFIPDESLITALKIASYSGVTVKLMLPAKGDNRWVQWASFSYLEELLDAGVECYLYEKGFLHAKTIVIDGQVSSVGTANLDNRSLKLNFEVNAFMYDSGIAGQLEQIYLDDLKSCRQLTLTEHQQRPLSRKLKEAIARLLSPIL
ncbi:cardiolipin synthase [Paenibacillus psychroresistens]|uniref:Cardiolipin synthase n=1 Tax=Paenibacillus psychroresistens TaxID=1778678 RepID=A0A6B8RSL5_9BACL|nr:cardiolipin synthase [Paenibacillus psychroresistens]QGQ98296.1 cardiolipin synthase [Paenibacillus psychroresistens]